jgi:hypothetical protein
VCMCVRGLWAWFFFVCWFMSFATATILVSSAK